MKTEYKKGIIALILLSLAFATMGAFSRYLSSGFTLLQQVYLRVFAAFLLGLLFFHNDLHLDKLKKISKREWGILFMRAFFGNLLGVSLLTKAYLMTSYSNVAFIGALPMIAILGVVLFKEKLTPRKFSLILLSFLGVVLIAIKDYSHLFEWGTGEIVAFLSTVALAISYVTRKCHGDLLNNKEIVQITLFFAFFMIFITSLVAGDHLPTVWNTQLFVAVMGAGLFNMIIFFLTNYGFQRVEAIVAGNIVTLKSVFATILGILLYREIPSLKDILGGGIIVGSVILMNQSTKKGKVFNYIQQILHKFQRIRKPLGNKEIVQEY